MFCGTWIILAFAHVAGVESFRSGSNERAGFFFLICVSVNEEMSYSFMCAVCMSSNFIGNSLLYMRPCFKVIRMSYVLKIVYGV